MNQLSLIIKTEVETEIKNKKFWIATLIVPVIMIAFGAIFGALMADSKTFMSTSEAMSITPDEETMTPSKIAGMLLGMCLTFFLMIFGSMIFTKVKTEKCNRIMEILSTCVDGKTMMLAKIISVGIIGFIQLLTWASLIIVGISAFYMIFQFAIPWEILSNPKFYLALIYMVLYFIGGYILFGSLYAACGAITDKDNENQAYMTVLTFILLGAFYIGQYAVDNGDGLFATICNYIPFTSPTVGTINAVSGVSPVWQTILSLIILYVSAYISTMIAGKLYRSSMLLRGKQFSPKDIITFIRS